MEANIVSLLIVLLFSVSVFSTPIYVKVSHQAPSYNTHPINVQINGNTIKEYTTISYGTGSVYVDLEIYSEDNEFLVTVFSDGRAVLNETETFSTQYHNTLFFVTTQESNIGLVVTTDDFQEPPQYSGSFRFIVFAPEQNNFQVYLNEAEDSDYTLEYGESTNYATYSDAIYQISIYNATGLIIDTTLTVQSGTVYTLVINGYPNSDPLYQLFSLADSVYEYPTCKVRAVNSVPDQQYNNLTITFDGELFVSDLAYSEISEFQDVEVGTYTVVFIVNNEQVQLTFACVSSELSSLVLIGNPSSGVELEAEQLADQNYATLYNLIRFKVVLLSPDPDASPSSVFVDQDLLQVVSYPDETSYTDQSTLPFNISLVSHNLNYYSQEIDENSVDFGETYTFFVFGLINSDLYPIEIKAELDFSPETTTTTTTSGGDDDDDDDDDGLSGGAIAGIVIGVLFGVIILVAIALFVVRRHNNRNPPDNSYAQFTAVG